MTNVDRGQRTAHRVGIPGVKGRKCFKEREDVNRKTKKDNNWKLAIGFSNIEVIGSLTRTVLLEQGGWKKWFVRVWGKDLEKAHVEEFGCKEDQRKDVTMKRKHKSMQDVAFFF